MYSNISLFVLVVSSMAVCAGKDSIPETKKDPKSSFARTGASDPPTLPRPDEKIDFSTFKLDKKKLNLNKRPNMDGLHKIPKDQMKIHYPDSSPPPLRYRDPRKLPLNSDLPPPLNFDDIKWPKMNFGDPLERLGDGKDIEHMCNADEEDCDDEELQVDHKQSDEEVTLEEIIEN
ncbi:uncharacterized protein LOC144348221 [Saccoglossus kowalevskii]